MIICGYFFSIVNAYFFDFDGPDFDVETEAEIFLVIAIVAPIFETLFLQTMLYKLLRITKIKSFYFYLISMSLVFSLLHTYNWFYIVMTFFNSLLINNFYIRIIQKKDTFTAFSLTALLHSLYNLYGYFFVVS